MQGRNIASVALGSKELETIREAAALMGVTISTLMGDAAIREARRIIVKRKRRCPTCGTHHVVRTRA